MADEVLKNWVALLEFKVDANQARDLLLKANSVSAALLGIAAAVEAASLAFKGLLLKASESVESTSFIAERAGGTVKDLTALREAAAATGSTFADADASIEGFAKQWRNGSIQNTVRETLRQAGMAKREIDDLFAAGNLFPILQKTIEAINAKKNPAAEDAYRRLFGINENLGRFHYEDFERAIKRTAERWDKAGINVEKLTENSKNLQHSWRGLWSSIDTIVKSVTEKLSPYLTEQIEKIVRLLDEHGKEIQQWITETVKQVGEFAKTMTGQAKPALDALNNVMTPIIASLRWLVNTFADLTGQTNKWQAALELLLGVMILRMLRARSIILGLISLLARHPIIAGLLAAGVAAWSQAAYTAAHPELPIDPETGFAQHPEVGGLDEKNKRELQNNPISRAGRWLWGKITGKTADTSDTPAVPPGTRVFPITGTMADELGHARSGGARHHAGVDLRGQFGDPVASSVDGTVLSASMHSGYGNTIDILGSDGLVYRYGTHWGNEMAVKQGDKVRAGQVIGTIGTGTTMPHVHHEVRTYESYKRDPYAHWMAGHPKPEGILDPAAVYGGLSRGSQFSRGSPVGGRREMPAAPAQRPEAKSPFGGLDADAIRKRLDRSGPAAPFHQSSNRYSFGQNVAVNIHGSDNDPATKIGSLAGPMHDARLLRNTKGAIA